MKHLFTIAFFTTAALFAINRTAHCQTGLHATVPFSFSVGTVTFPPGSYDIRHRDAFVYFRSHDGRIGSVLAPFSSAPSRDGQGRLVFDRCNGLYFLRDIVAPSTMAGVAFPKSRLERQAEASTDRADP